MCSVRSGKLRCHATVSQKGDQFMAGVKPHCRPANPRLPVFKEVAAVVRFQQYEMFTVHVRNNYCTPVLIMLNMSGGFSQVRKWIST